MLTLLPPTLMIGATFPFAVRLLASGSEDAGRERARLRREHMSSIAGAVGAGFFLIPALGFEGMLGMGVAINLLLAALAALALRAEAALAPRGGCHRRGSRWRWAPPAPPWQMLRSTSLSAKAPGLGGASSPTSEVGRSSTVLVTDQHLGFGLRTNGLPEGGDRHARGCWHNRHPLTRWLTALPVLARPEVRTPRGDRLRCRGPRSRSFRPRSNAST